MSAPNRYARIIERVFLDRYRPGDREVSFARTDLETTAAQLRVALPKNLGDLVYSFRYRVDLPAPIRDRAPEGTEWLILPNGRGRYKFAATSVQAIQPSPRLAETKIPNATPGIITLYKQGDEQALLANLRYNRLIDIFTGVASYSLQNHLRTTVGGMGQVETDEVYVGIDRRGAHYVFPVQAKGPRERLSVVQIGQDFALCAEKFPELICRPIGAQFMRDDLIALFEFESGSEGVVVSAERHYRLVPPDSLSAEDLSIYRTRSEA